MIDREQAIRAAQRAMPYTMAAMAPQVVDAILALEEQAAHERDDLRRALEKIEREVPYSWDPVHLVDCPHVDTLLSISRIALKAMRSIGSNPGADETENA